MEQLQRLAAELGLTIIEAEGEHLGGYRPDENTVRLRPGLPRRAARSVLAHEIGHHVLGHLPQPFGPLRKRQERAANEWAARHLISAAGYAEAERIHEGHVGTIAHTLDVHPELVIAYQRILQRALIASAA